jgi:hypothetical protein
VPDFKSPSNGPCSVNTCTRILTHFLDIPTPNNVEYDDESEDEDGSFQGGPSPDTSFDEDATRTAQIPESRRKLAKLYTQFMCPVFASIPVALYPPTVTNPHALPFTATPTNILLHLKRTKADAMVIMPAMLQIWAQEEKDVEFFKGLKVVVSVCFFDFVTCYLH